MVDPANTQHQLSTRANTEAWLTENQIPFQVSASSLGCMGNFLTAWPCIDMHSRRRDEHGGNA